MNVCSLTKTFDDFNVLLSELNVSFEIFAITESKIKKNSPNPINLQLNNCSIEHTAAKSSAGGTLLYKNKGLSYQLRKDLRISDPRKIELPFIEIIRIKPTNAIVVCMHKRPTLAINDFTNEFISPLLLNLQKESSKIIFLLGNFNIDLLKYEISDSINNFLDTLSSNFLFLPTRISKTFTLIHHIFFKPNFFRGN